jgi:H+/Cl- antiporter ClcA
MGATLGATYHNIIQDNLDTLILPFVGAENLEIAGTPAFAMVGAASVLAALFKAPLTGSILLFELTRDY